MDAPILSHKMVSLLSRLPTGFAIDLKPVRQMNTIWRKTKATPYGWLYKLAIIPQPNNHQQISFTGNRFKMKAFPGCAVPS